MKNTGVPVSRVLAKLIQMLPSMTRISSSGMPNERKVKSRITMTSSSDMRLTIMLSRAKHLLKS